MAWKPRIRADETYILKIPDTSIKHRETRALLHGRRVTVIRLIDSHRGHGVYKVKLENDLGFPKTFPKEFKMWGPYLCCDCPRPYGCKCGGY